MEVRRERDRSFVLSGPGGVLPSSNLSLCALLE